MSDTPAAPRMEFTIPESANEPYISGAALFGLLAVPAKSQADRRYVAYADALCYRAVMQELEADAALVRTPRIVTPAFLILGATQARKLASKTAKALHDRMAAAHAAIPFFAEAERLAAGGQPDRRRRRKVDHEAQRVIASEAERQEWLKSQGLPIDRRFPSDANNFDNRVIKPSLPVLHIAVAVALVMNDFESELRKRPAAIQEAFPKDMQGAQISLDFFLRHPDLVRAAVVRASKLAALLPHLQKLRPAAKSVVHVTIEPTSAG